MQQTLPVVVAKIQQHVMYALLPTSENDHHTPTRCYAQEKAFTGDQSNAKLMSNTNPSNSCMLPGVLKA
jgi:hypothetical protein